MKVCTPKHPCWGCSECGFAEPPKESENKLSRYQRRYISPHISKYRKGNKQGYLASMLFLYFRGWIDEMPSLNLAPVAGDGSMERHCVREDIDDWSHPYSKFSLPRWKAEKPSFGEANT